MAFVDAGEGYNYSCGSPLGCTSRISSVGLGFRYGLGKQVAFQAYASSAYQNSGPISAPFAKDRGSFALQVTF
jgi:hypothetical protein